MTVNHEVRAIIRNLHEAADAILMRQLIYLIEARTVYVDGNFLYISYRAFFYGMLGHLNNVLNTNQKSGSFHWIFQQNADESGKFARSRGYDINFVWEMAGKLRTIRNKTLFHLDRKALVTSGAVCRKAKISGSDVGRVLEILWHSLQYIHMIKTGGYYFSIPALERKSTELVIDHIAQAIEDVEVSLESMSPTHLYIDLK